MTGEKIKNRLGDISSNIKATADDMKSTSVAGALFRHWDRFGVSNRKLIKKEG